LLLEVFTQRNLVTDLLRLKLNFIQKTKQSFLSHPLEDFGGNVRTPSTACWSTSYRHNWTYFAIF